MSDPVLEERPKLFIEDADLPFIHVHGDRIVCNTKTDCSNCVRKSSTYRWCTYTVSELLPYLHIHHPELFI